MDDPELDTLSGSFYCPSMPSGMGIHQRRGISVYDIMGLSTLPYRFFPRPPSERAAFWDIDLGNPWGALKNDNPDYFQNILVMEDRLANYPFPDPFEDFAFIWARHAIEGLRELVRQPGQINETIARVWITMSVLNNYEAMIRDLQDYYEEQAENARRRGIVFAIGTLAVGALIGIGVAAAGLPGVISKGFSSLSSQMSKRDQESLAEDLEKVEEGFRNQSPAFANEVKFTSDLFKFLSDEAEDLAGMSPEEQNNAVQRAIMGVPTWVIVLGSLAVAGVGGYFVLKG